MPNTKLEDHAREGKLDRYSFIGFIMALQREAEAEERELREHERKCYAHRDRLTAEGDKRGAASQQQAALMARQAGSRADGERALLQVVLNAAQECGLM
jgi:hypothetical protein